MNERNRDYIVFPLGLLSIATHLAKFGHTMKIVDRTSVLTNIKKEIDTFKPDVIGISIISSKQIKDTIKICKYAKSLNIKTVFGNTLASSVPELIL